jgi:histidinol-phosphate aminotransferase
MSGWLQDKLAQLDRAEGYVMPESTTVEEEPATGHDIIKLDANENIFIPREVMVSLAREVVEALDPRFYSTAEYHQLARALAARAGLTPEHIVLGNGGDQIIDFVARTFLDASSKAVSIAPTYSFYRLRAKLTGAAWTEVPLNDDFSLDLDRLLDEATDAQMIFLCSPNNPTGNRFEADQLTALLRVFDGIVFVDEAYAEFADDTLAGWVKEFRHLVILRTFSKAFGLAGLRIGYMLADPAIIRPFAEKMQYPYGVSAFSLRMGLKLLERYELIQHAVEQMKTERARLMRELNSIEGIRAFDSQTNFVLFELDQPAESVHERLIDAGLFVKWIGDVLSHRNCLRTTVGTPEINDQLIGELKRICER